MLAVVLAFVVAALAGAVIPRAPGSVQQSEGRVQVLLVPGPIHYDIVLPLDARTRRAPD